MEVEGVAAVKLEIEGVADRLPLAGQLLRQCKTERGLPRPPTAKLQVGVGPRQEPPLQVRAPPVAVVVQLTM